MKKTTQIIIRLSEEEKNKIKDISKKYNFENISDYIRFVSLNEKIKIIKE
jgi:hypothetical protein